MLVGTLVNTGAVIIGSLIGLLLGNILPERLRDTVMKGLGLCTLFVGIDGMLGGSNALIAIISVAVGAVIGELCDLDGHLNRFAEGLEKKFRKSQEGGPSLAEGFVTGSLVLCVGAMAIVGSLQAGLSGDYETLFTKAVLVLIGSMVFASTLGIGVMLSAGLLFLFQGGIVLLAQVISPFLTDAVIAEMVCSGSLMIFALGLNVLGITKLKVLNFLPAIFLPIVLCPLIDMVM